MADALVAAAADAGIRITLLDTCYLRGGPGVELDPVQQRLHRRRPPSSGPTRVDRLRAGAARRASAPPSTRCAPSPPTTSRPSPRGPRRATRRCTPTSPSSRPRTSRCWPPTARTPVELLAAAGALDERFTAVHATHLTDRRRRPARRQPAAACCICPTTERDLADGIGPTVALRDAGARLTLGSDSHAVIDLLEEARAVELDERLASLRRGGHEPAALLRMATTDGHASLGWPDAGRIEVGAVADLTSVAPRLGAHRRHRRGRRRRRRRVRGDGRRRPPRRRRRPGRRARRPPHVDRRRRRARPGAARDARSSTGIGRLVTNTDDGELPDALAW